MRCPRCQSGTKQSVEDTRQDENGHVRRRRRCGNCREHYTTVEVISERSLRVRKTDGAVVPFDREAVQRGIRRATVRKYRKSSAAELEHLGELVFNDAYARSEGGVIESRKIGMIVLDHLKRVDRPTHIRYALVELGRRDRDDEREGWVDADDVRSWLLAEYPELEHWRPPAKLVTVVKRSGEREQFDRAKLERSIGHAAKGRRTREEIHQLATEVAEEVYRTLADQPMVTSGQIAAEILRSLRDRDHIAYLRYASAAKRFDDPKDFEAESVAVRNREARRRAPKSRRRTASG